MHSRHPRLTVEVTDRPVGHDQLEEGHVHGLDPLLLRLLEHAGFHGLGHLLLLRVKRLLVILSQKVLGNFDIFSVTLLVILPQVLSVTQLIGPKVLKPESYGWSTLFFFSFSVSSFTLKLTGRHKMN